MISFQNTEVAFKSKSDFELRRAHLLFQLIGYPPLVKVGKVLSTWAMRWHLPVKGLIKSTIFKQFVGGETIEECRPVMQKLGEYGVGTILDYSVEGQETPEGFEHTLHEIIGTLHMASGQQHMPFGVFKVSGIAPFSLLEAASANKNFDPSRADWQGVRQRVARICEEAKKLRVPILIDAEESWIQPAIDALCEEQMRLLNTDDAWVFNTVQLYRHDRLAYLRDLSERAQDGGFFCGVKLVRGAYMEKERDRAEEMGYPSPIQPNKEASDRDFDAAVLYCVQHLDRIRVCAGSHNEQSNLLLTQLMAQYNIAPSDKRVWFAQLLGMSDHISFNLADGGYNVAKYVPYGPVREVLPYLIRRTEENTSVKGQTGRELRLIREELKRRKTAR